MSLLDVASQRPKKLGVICQPLSRPARSPKAGGDLSTVGGGNGGGSSGGKVGGDLSTVVDIDRRRRERGISISRLLNAAGVHEGTWSLGKRGGRTRPDTIERLEAALVALHPLSRQARPPAAIAALVRSIEFMLIREIGRDRRLMAACDPKRRRNRLPAQVPTGRLRLFAVYLAAVDLEIGNAELARALGIERQAIKQARDTVHDLRDDTRVDALLDRCGALLIGGPEK